MIEYKPKEDNVVKLSKYVYEKKEILIKIEKDGNNE